MSSKLPEIINVAGYTGVVIIVSFVSIFCVFPDS